MPLHVIALGDAGARMSKALLYALCAGVTPRQMMTVTLMCAGQEAASGAFAAWQDYFDVYCHTGAGSQGCLDRQAELLQWPEEQAAFSLNDQASGELDQLLNRALFTREQASLSPARAMDAGYDMAAMTWAGLLSNPPTGALLRLKEDLADPETRVVLLGSLCDAVCASGVQALCTWMSRITERKPAASLLLPVYPGEDGSLCQRILSTANLEERLSSLCIAGLPEDCRPGEAGGPQLCDWLAAYAACRQLTGLTGSHLWRIRTSSIGWSVFGEDAAAWQQGFERLMQTAYLLACAYGDQLEAAVSARSRLRDRMTPWYNAHFSAVRKMSEAETAQLLHDMQALKRLLGGYAAWMDQLQRSLPSMMRWAEALKDVRAAAEAHYRQVLDVVGQYTWLAMEIRRSGMEEESIVHRHSMMDTEAEAAVKKRDALLDQLSELSSEQDELNHQLGGRLTRSMLSNIAAFCAAEADEQREIVRQAMEIIDRAAAIANEEEQSRVATSRVRLARKERLVQMLDGRTAQARRDAERWGGAALRRLAPQLPAETETSAVPALFAEDWLTPMLAWYEGDEKAAKQLQEQWPFEEVPFKPLCERIARNEFPDAGLDCLGSFVSCMLRSLTAL